MMNRFNDIDCSFKRLTPVYGYHSQDLVPLEKALEPIEPQIRELPRYIRTAKKYCHYPSEHGLSKDQSAAVYIYTMEWGDTTLYRVLNNTLRSENRQALKIWFPYLKLFDTALDMLPTVKESVWRGVPLDIGKNFTKNQLVTWWSISSCSSSVNVIKNFVGNEKNSALFLIEAINGEKVSGYTEFENEDEIILRMGTQFRVKSEPLPQSNGSYIVHLIEINDNNDEPLASTMNNMDVTSEAASKSASGYSGVRITTQSIRAPTPAAKCAVNPQSQNITPRTETPKSQKIHNPVHDLLRNIAQSCNLVAHGKGNSAVELNEQMKNDIRVHKFDLKMAEKQVIGRTLREDEWDDIPEAQREIYSQQMLEVVKTRIQIRYTAGRK